jgi:hypothetical protein
MNGELKKEGVTEMRVRVLKERTSKTQQVREKALGGSKWLMYSENMRTSTNALASMSTKLSEAANAFETAWHPAASRTAPDPIRSQSPPKPAVACVRVPRGDTVTRGCSSGGVDWESGKLYHRRASAGTIGDGRVGQGHDHDSHGAVETADLQHAE